MPTPAFVRNGQRKRDAPTRRPGLGHEDVQREGDETDEADLWPLVDGPDATEDEEDA